MPVLGYGEDSLCHWALTKRLPRILERLGDTSEPAEAEVYTRLSFGRSGNLSIKSGETADSPQFGEFDAVIGTKVGIYLIEAKWQRSSEVTAEAIRLSPVQLRRHAVLRAYLRKWQGTEQPSWEIFTRGPRRSIPVEDFFYPLPPAGSQLAQNLELVLTSLNHCGNKVSDVILYLQMENERDRSRIVPDGFRLVTIKCPTDNGFIDFASD